MINRINSLLEYCKEYQHSIDNPESFWEKQALHFHWRQKWDKVLEWNFDTPKIEWFKNGKLNITENALDRHLKKNPDQVAIIWEPNDPDEPPLKLTYAELHRRTCQFANALCSTGITKGDRVIIYMPMVVEAAVAMLACARVGAIHSVVFAGFSAHSLADRINDCQAKMVITSDGNFRGTKSISVKKLVDQAIELTQSIQTVVVLKRTGEKITMKPNRDVWWNDIVSNASFEHEPCIMDAEDPLFILYTSGSTGKPKGVVHTTAGYMVYTAYTFVNVFQYQQGEIYWCTADVGWITGHSYIVYGPLLAGATTFMFEGVPTYPNPGRFWEIVDRHKINQFYTAPTAIRALQACGDDIPQKYSLDSLKVIGSVGEPINKEAWHWYHKHIGRGKCPIVDTWWQTETGGIMISPLAGITPIKPTFASLPLPGVQPILVDHQGIELKEKNVKGNLCIRFPWPGILRTTWGDHQRCKETYFSAYKGKYFTGDGAKRDHDGYLRILGRVDDVINVSGHRLGTAEIENAINAHHQVTESAVVGYPHPIKGEGIYAYIVTSDVEHINKEQLIDEVIKEVRTYIGPIAKPDQVLVVSDLPKTRSGKIMRRILRKVASRDVNQLGDISTLLNPDTVGEIIKAAGLK
ncbi:MAG: acetate--CoA ligase [Flavobacteriaceae bacterium]|nr:acetate--CoA ligase [Flavobacteriaceae bacterium]